MIYKNYILLIIFYSWFIIGCGIYSFSGASIPEDAQTLSVDYIKNQAEHVQPNLSNSLTESLINKCLT